MDKVMKQPTTPIEHTESKHTKHQTQCELMTFILLLRVAPSECGIRWGSDYPWETPHPRSGLWMWRTRCPCWMHRGHWLDPPLVPLDGVVGALQPGAERLDLLLGSQ
jgi:hypothetical protein